MDDDNYIDDSDRPLPMPPEGHPLRNLGKRLAELLDEDKWTECERLLLDGWEHDRIDRKTGSDWRENSSLEVWFPFTSEAHASEVDHLRMQRDAWKEVAEHQYGLLRFAKYGDADYPVAGALDVWATGRHPVLTPNE